ncbi:hypothetical protein ACN2XU_14585 [Primorskyibacter sp. 2E107]|uniref:hypothetical protein n=1 Tax=Primorskyibacter sp. 2E107 TaxID=3403458 RepID=UPI003AF7BC3E
MPDPFTRLSAQGWVWNAANAAGCIDGLFYSVSADRKTIWFETGAEMDLGGVKTDRGAYRVLGQGPQSIDMAMEQEWRRDDTGDLVWWRLIFVTAETFVWVRSDWHFPQATKPLTACAPIG